MPRCGCGSASATCNCTFAEGTDVGITGGGSEASPYVIGLTSNTPSELEVDDSPTISLTLTGDGQPGTPYEIEAELVEPVPLPGQDLISPTLNDPVLNNPIWQGPGPAVALGSNLSNTGPTPGNQKSMVFSTVTLQPSSTYVWRFGLEQTSTNTFGEWEFFYPSGSLVVWHHDVRVPFRHTGGGTASPNPFSWSTTDQDAFLQGVVSVGATGGLFRVLARAATWTSPAWSSYLQAQRVA